MFKFGPLQTAWLKLLESGKLPQTRSALCTVNPQTGKVNGFCCLGVAEAGVMKRKPHVQLKKLMAADINHDSELNVYFGTADTTLTEATRRVMKFRSGSGDSFNFDKDSLAEMNDDGKTFEEIAQKVRENPERYFTGPA